MIQRIQSVYILLAAIISVVCICLPLGTFALAGVEVSTPLGAFTFGGGLEAGTVYNLCISPIIGNCSYESVPLFIVQVFSIVFGIITIFRYNNRKAQAMFCLFNALLQLCWYIVYVVVINITIGDLVSYEIGFATWLPIASIVLYLLARRSIIADEKLVRAADRIR